MESVAIFESEVYAGCPRGDSMYKNTSKAKSEGTTKKRIFSSNPSFSGKLSLEVCYVILVTCYVNYCRSRETTMKQKKSITMKKTI